MTKQEENRLDTLLQSLIDGNNVDDWKSLNRLEQYLVCLLTKQGMEDLGEPMNRLEVLLQALYSVVPENALEILSARLEETVESD